MKKLVFLFLGLALLFGALQIRRCQNISRIEGEIAEYVDLHSGGRYYFSWNKNIVPSQCILPTRHFKTFSQDDRKSILELACSPYVKERYSSLLKEELSEWNFTGLMCFSLFFGGILLIIEIIKTDNYENKKIADDDHSGHLHAGVELVRS